MKYILLLFTLIGIAGAGEIVVVIPSASDSDGYDAGMPQVEPFAELKFESEPEMKLSQEGQMTHYIYKNVKPGVYRVSLNPIGPIGVTEILMETHVTMKEDATVTVFLCETRKQEIALPEDVAAALKKHPNGMIELTVRYKGSDKVFYQVRSLPGIPGGLDSLIHYLRSDAEYHIKVSDFQRNGDTHNNPVVFEKKIKIKDNAAPEKEENPDK